MATSSIFDTQVFFSLDTGDQYVRSNDPETPTARVVEGVWADCECGTRILLQENGDEGWPTGLEYQQHYYQEHTRPRLRAEETAQ